MTRYHLRADKGFGQNFLVDPAALRAIVGAAELTPNDTVLEIGPGLGVLTRELAAQAGEVVAVELDGRLLPALRETLAGLSNVTLIHGDGLELDLTSFPENSLLVANLPYNVATPILVRTLESGRFRRLVFLVQKEVAQRLSAAPGTPAYGALSLVIAHFGRSKSLRDVKSSSFLPPPEVTSSVVRVDSTPGVAADPALFRLVHEGFAHRRKTLKKNLLLAGYPAEQIAQAFADTELDMRIRAETLDISTFKKLFDALARYS